MGGLTAPELRTDRLVLRAWHERDLAPFAAMNADPVVMEHFPAPLTRAESDAFVERIRAHFAERGFGLWAVEVPGELEFAGFVGLSTPNFETDFTPCVEIGWRLACAAWGRGYATEAARASLDHAFGALGLDEVLSWTVPANRPSVAVMERIGMQRLGEFDHPKLAADSPLRRHVRYGITRAQHAG